MAHRTNFELRPDMKKNPTPTAAEKEVEAAFHDWMSALSDYNHARETTRDEKAIQRAYDAMNVARTKYRNLKQLRNHV